MLGGWVFWGSGGIKGWRVVSTPGCIQDYRHVNLSHVQIFLVTSF